MVIFDESAEHLDEDTATALMKDLMTETSGRTRIVITHRQVPGQDNVRALCLRA
ncbi:MAG TPA: hypothetical protein VMU95_19485 [Trebonia sp.]|nr:hypothetical protein [Trebonia sp.]